MHNWFRNFIKRLLNQRTFVVTVVFVIIFAVLLQRVFVLQILRGSSYQENFTLKIQKTRQIPSTRGNIYDRNGELLAYNDLAYTVTIEDDGTYDDLKRSQRNKALNDTIKDVIGIIEGNGDKVISDFGIALDEDGKYAFTAETKSGKLRFLADVYGYAKTNELSKKEKNSTAADVMAYLMSDERYDLKGVDDKELALKVINIRYLMTLKSYTKYIATEIATDVCDETVAQINENKDKYPGVDIAQGSVRRYVDSTYFAPVIGYTGTISEDEYAELSDEVVDRYSKQSVVGKSGVEQYMDEELQGVPGEETLFVDSVGKVLLTTDVTEPEAGNNVYLSIDKNLQEQTYKILERELAGIVLRHLTDELNYEKPEDADTTAINIPIGDVYAAFFTNGILNSSDIALAADNSVQHKIYETMHSYQDTAIDMILKEITSPTKKRVDYNDELEDYVSYYLRTFLSSEGIMLTDEIDPTAKEYKAWTESQKSTLRDYLSYAISQNWIDTQLLGIEGKYTDTDEVLSKLVEYSKENMKDSYSLSLLCYKYLVKSGKISGSQVCAAAIEQGVFTDKDLYAEFKKGGGDPYRYISNKIYTLELTPGELGLEPCSGSAIITDPSNGDVLACVSYPGYDSNRLSNTMDKKYYQQLALSASKPLYNHATQEKTAPGSTYKMVTALAGLDTGCITGDSLLECSGIFTAVNPSPKCWYTAGHGNLDVVGAITNSCNLFFYQVGWGLSQEDTSDYPIGITTFSDDAQENLEPVYDENGNIIDFEDKPEKKVNQYSNIKGLSKLHEYASMFGLNEVSGLELVEAKPEISDEDAVRSAIGQGTNNYAISQMSVYVTAVANGGTVYNYSVFDRVEDTRGNVLKEYGSTVRHKIETDPENFKLLQQGMIEMVANSSQFNGIFTDAGGKTGTAQESLSHPDHVLFIGYTPAHNPKISLAVRIAHGYTSAYPAEIGNKIFRLYNGKDDEDHIIGDTAYSLGASARTD